ncbi:BfmA/BtgA family mobilization protein [Maribacter sp. M208]|uniref:BfmA/BtgA family mobilization protein n=1 Tax=Maribacter huludaoensis TaxID=3030010 RepID=UPI0023ECB2A2|nr:BfmA/BtgA family mobilization protein [Maribacter huludaoensis]MDF4221077.1 BfmA/BtgA family mobilization protein [Maribacter huludaoensis]
MKKKSIIIGQRGHKDIKTLSETFGSSIGSLVEAMITYFKRTGINPRDAINESPSTMIKALDKRIVSFLRVQERDILKPMRDEVYANGQLQKESLEGLTDNLQNLLSQMNSADQKRTDYVKTELYKMQIAFNVLAEFLDERDKSGINSRLRRVFDHAN